MCLKRSQVSELKIVWREQLAAMFGDQDNMLEPQIVRPPLDGRAQG